MQAAVRGGVPQVFVFQGERGSGKSDGARAAVLYFSTVARAVTLRLSARVDALRTQALDAALRAASKQAEPDQ
jgi:3-hydroxyisobutyrate dehydrogenase-like beta-hydroxyacid dehydrogenase